jgi:hypothetical protein
MTLADLLGLVLLGIATSLGLAVLAGGLLTFGEERLDLEADELAERWRRALPPRGDCRLRSTVIRGEGRA